MTLLKIQTIASPSHRTTILTDSIGLSSFCAFVLTLIDERQTFLTVYLLLKYTGTLDFALAPICCPIYTRFFKKKDFVIKKAAFVQRKMWR